MPTEYAPESDFALLLGRNAEFSGDWSAVPGVKEMFDQVSVTDPHLVPVMNKTIKAWQHRARDMFTYGG